MLTAGCGGARPTPSPGGMVAVLGALAAHGASVTDVVAGDSGCSDPSLHDNAQRITLTLAADGRTYEVYLLRWRRQSDFDAAAAAFAACVADAAASPGGADAMETVELAPWRAYGPGWGREMRDVIAQSLASAAGGQ